MYLIRCTYLQGGMAMHSSILALENPTDREEPGGLHRPQGRTESDTTEATEGAQDACRNDTSEGLPGGPVVKNPAGNAGDTTPILARADPTCHRATKPVSDNSLSPRAQEPSFVREAQSPGAKTQSSLCSPQLEKALGQQ